MSEKKLKKKVSKNVYFLSKKVFVENYVKYKERKRTKNIVEFFFLGTRYNYAENRLVSNIFSEVYGIGFIHQIRFLNFLKVGMSFRLYQYTEKMRAVVERLLRSLLVGYERNQVVENHFYEKYKVASYHTVRLKMGLPIRGQRTRSNAGSYKRKRRVYSKPSFRHKKNLFKHGEKRNNFVKRK
jgi:ribosomal protein S13